jgi:flagellar protein FlbT
MPTHVLELHAGETLIVSGTRMRFRTKGQVEVPEHTRFLFGKQIMSPDEADTPARLLYLALQDVYTGSEDERARGLAAVRERIAEFGADTAIPLVREVLWRTLALVERDECGPALKLVARLIRHENAVLRRSDAELPLAA